MLNNYNNVRYFPTGNIPYRDFFFKHSHRRSSYYAVIQVHNENCKILSKVTLCQNQVFPTISDCFKRKEFAPPGSKFFSLREVSFMKKDANDDNRYSF